jgi:hypothetical protein
LNEAFQSDTNFGGDDQNPSAQQTDPEIGHIRSAAVDEQTPCILSQIMRLPVCSDTCVLQKGASPEEILGSEIFEGMKNCLVPKKKSSSAALEQDDVMRFERVAGGTIEMESSSYFQLSVIKDVHCKERDSGNHAEPQGPYPDDAGKSEFSSPSTHHASSTQEAHQGSAVLDHDRTSDDAAMMRLVSCFMPRDEGISRPLRGQAQCSADTSQACTLLLSAPASSSNLHHQDSDQHASIFSMRQSAQDHQDGFITPRDECITFPAPLHLLVQPSNAGGALPCICEAQATTTPWLRHQGDGAACSTSSGPHAIKDSSQGVCLIKDEGRCKDWAEYIKDFNAAEETTALSQSENSSAFHTPSSSVLEDEATPDHCGPAVASVETLMRRCHVSSYLSSAVDCSHLSRDKHVGMDTASGPSGDVAQGQVGWGNNTSVEEQQRTAGMRPLVREGQQPVTSCSCNDDDDGGGAAASLSNSTAQPGHMDLAAFAGPDGDLLIPKNLRPHNSTVQSSNDSSASDSGWFLNDSWVTRWQYGCTVQ